MSDLDHEKAPMTADEQKAYQARQKQRALIMGLLLAFLVVLFYLITVVKIGTSV